jgi:hypothetical protein
VSVQTLLNKIILKKSQKKGNTEEDKRGTNKILKQDKKEKRKKGIHLNIAISCLYVTKSADRYQHFRRNAPFNFLPNFFRS